MPFTTPLMLMSIALCHFSQARSWSVLMLVLTSITGFALLMFRDTAAIGMLLAVHLGVVLGLFLSMPYGKFVHGLYRFLALTKFASERRHGTFVE